MAMDAGMDLVEISPNVVPPVCKIMDYGKYKYSAQKKAAEARKKQKVVEIKEIKLRPMIDDHDYDVKMRAMQRFFEEGDKVKITLRYRGREMAHQEIGTKLLDKVKADVFNVVPPQRAGDIAAKSGVKLINGRWVDINWQTFESVNTPGVHVIGDAIFPAPTMPKSGHMANQHAKVTAAAILNLLAGEAPNPAPVVMNTCYSFVDSKNVIHVTSVHQYDAEKKTVLPVPGSGGVSAAANEIEGKAAMAWARNIWADMLA